MWFAIYLMMNYNNDTQENKVVADMSDVEPRSFFRRGFSLNREEKKEPVNLSKEETKWYILGTLKASFLIASVYIVVLGLFILLIVLGYNYLIK